MLGKCCVLIYTRRFRDVRIWFFGSPEAGDNIMGSRNSIFLGMSVSCLGQLENEQPLLRYINSTEIPPAIDSR
jgi:hypothetical protein